MKNYKNIRGALQVEYIMIICLIAVASLGGFYALHKALADGEFSWGNFLSNIVSLRHPDKEDTAGYVNTGDGTVANPYTISTVSDWNKYAGKTAYKSSHFVVTRDITVPEGQVLLPWSWTTGFSGTLDGKGPAVSETTIDENGDDVVIVSNPPVKIIEATFAPIETSTGAGTFRFGVGTLNTGASITGITFENCTISAMLYDGPNNSTFSNWTTTVNGAIVSYNSGDKASFDPSSIFVPIWDEKISGGGSGTADDPYVLQNINDWNIVARNVNYSTKYIKFGNDIYGGVDYKNTKYATSWGSLWSGVPFTGTLDGDNHRLSMVGITGSFIQTANGSNVKDLTLSYCSSGNPTPTDNGLLIGTATGDGISLSNINIDHCTGSIGVIGSIPAGSLVSSVNVSNSIFFQSGFAGNVTSSQISNCSSYKNCIGSSGQVYVGDSSASSYGFIGTMVNSTIDNCDIDKNNYNSVVTRGFAGNVTASSVIKNCTISNSSIDGQTGYGFAETLDSTSLIDSCSLTGGKMQGGYLALYGFIGSAAGTINNCSLYNITMTAGSSYSYAFGTNYTTEPVTAVGFAGTVTGKLSNCSISGISSSSKQSIGAWRGVAYGFVQTLSSGGNVTGCVMSNMSILVNTTGNAYGFVGAVNGLVNACNVSYCTVLAQQGGAAFGFSGDCYGSIQNSISSYNTITATADVVGFSNNIYLNGKLVNCQANYNTLTSSAGNAEGLTEMVRGVVSQCATKYNTLKAPLSATGVSFGVTDTGYIEKTISYYNMMTATGTTGFVTGITGEITASGGIKNCYVIGDATHKMVATVYSYGLCRSVGDDNGGGTNAYAKNCYVSSPMTGGDRIRGLYATSSNMTGVTAQNFWDVTLTGFAASNVQLGGVGLTTTDIKSASGSIIQLGTNSGVNQWEFAASTYPKLVWE